MTKIIITRHDMVENAIQAYALSENQEMGFFCLNETHYGLSLPTMGNLIKERYDAFCVKAFKKFNPIKSGDEFIFLGFSKLVKSLGEETWLEMIERLNRTLKEDGLILKQTHETYNHYTVVAIE